MRLDLVAASPAHVGRIATFMRAADREEAAAFGRSPKDALRSGIRASSFALTARLDGMPIAMMGVVPVSALEGIGRPWLLGTDDVPRCARALLTGADAVIAQMHRRFRRLENLVSVTNGPAVRMLRRWGFEVGEEVIEVKGVSFVRFWKEADRV